MTQRVSTVAGTIRGQRRRRQEEKEKKNQMAGGGASVVWSHDREGGAPCHGTSCPRSLSVAAVGVTTRAVCVNFSEAPAEQIGQSARIIRRKLSLISRRLPRPRSHALSLFTPSPAAQAAPQNCVEGGQGDSGDPDPSRTQEITCSYKWPHSSPLSCSTFSRPLKHK